MSTIRLFWNDPYQQQFDAHVVRRVECAGRPAVTLNATCFYPTSGGQPHDTGYLDDIPVLDVIEQDGEIFHILSGPIAADQVRGTIDWARRFDHMQQHAGQHILSAAFQQLLDARTVSFHLGSAYCTIDLDRPDLAVQDVEGVEDLANQVIFESRSISFKEYEEQELESVSLRKASQVNGLVRVVSIADFDHSACGGTHPHTSGEVGLIHIDRWEKRRGQTRVSFLCGLRALHDYRHKSTICYDLANRSSVAIADLPDAIERLEAVADSARREATQLRIRWLDLETNRLIGQAKPLGSWRIICRQLSEPFTADDMRYLTQRIIETPGMVAILGVDSPSAQFCLGRSQDVDLDMSRLLTELAGPYGGRGGGQAHLAQGGGLSAEDLAAMIDQAEIVLSRQL